MVLTKRLVEIDLEEVGYADPAFWLSEDGPDIFLRLPDPAAGRARRPSDAELRVSQYGEYVGFSAHMGGHCLGCVWNPSELTEFFARASDCTANADATAAPVRLELYDRDQAAEAEDRNGIEVIVAGDAVRVELGLHCFGQAKGPQVREFFRRASLRAALKPEPRAA